MMRSMLRAAAVLAAILCVQSAIAEERDVVVNAPAGMLRGIERDGLEIFKGVRYALPPVGDLRWKPPVAAPRSEGVVDARKFAPACVQLRADPNSIYAEPLELVSEDCLFLNIWKPKDAKNAPVFVWIHGGALRTGASSLEMYDGEALARRGLIVVSINYRLGVLGYLAHPQLSAESPQGVSGNYGLLDQIAALEWVRENIESFGGNPSNVTIAGESAGALSVMYLMASPRARGLFHKAIAQSAYMVSTPALKEPRFGMPAAEAAGMFIANALGAKDIAALRAMDVRALVRRSNDVGFVPWGVVDGVVLPDELVNVFDRGEQARVPIIAGFNSGEIRSLRMLLPKPPANRKQYESAIRKGYRDLADEFLKLYPSEAIEESMLAATRDAMYGWTSERLVRAQTDVDAQGYLYYFDHGYPAADEAGLHAFHASEIPYVFGTLDRTTPTWPKIPDTSVEKRMSDAMLDYWSSFARDGVPRAAGGPEWRPYAEHESYMKFSAVPEAAADPLPGMFELHEEIMRRRRAANIGWNWNVGVAAPPLPSRVPERR
jgi:para-nitrobenzyl esterase